ncbi:cysteine hydrolase family protein [Bryobacter aggregatus]|uniref:cysteine hydrolase family protein n=1 Tax=Bryobacter aggregatus TaxID=360054 RepID=UPI0004E208B7|nr:isochorismatase family cysteine hydrolase [Bryobacter aggregatus]
MPTLYLDIDTQLDFVFPAGALYVPGAEWILPQVEKLNREAIEQGHSLLATVDAHTENDPEFVSWPPHCVQGSLGQRKPERLTVPGLRILEKQNVNCFTNPQMEEFLREKGITRAVVYGVVTEICVLHAAYGLLDRGIEVTLRTDATKELNSAARDQFFQTVRARGGQIL